MLTPDQRKIIGCLIYTESFAHILEEVGGYAPVVADDLKQLIDKRMVQVLEQDEKGEFQKTYFHDTDNMHLFFYRATERGLSVYGNPS